MTASSAIALGTIPLSASAAAPPSLGPRLRALRHDRHMTLDAVAAATGLDKGFLSRLERGSKAPSIATVLKLSAALSVSVAELFGEVVPHDAVVVTRAGEAEGAVSRVGGHRFEALVPGGAMLDVFMLHPGPEFVVEGSMAPGEDNLAAGASARGEAHRHDGEEFFFVLTGTIEVQFADRAVVLEEGDCARFPGHLAHRIRRLNEAPAAAIVAVARPQHAARSGRGRPPSAAVASQHQDKTES